MVATLRTIFSLLGAARLVAAACYRPDGSEVDDTYRPCNGSSEASMCCHLAFANNGGDQCGSGPTYGLCGVTGTQLWRESCTDPTWKSPLCLRLCIDGQYNDNDAEITQCVDGSYCCGINNATCCGQKKGVYIVDNKVVTALPQSAGPSSSGGSTPTSSPTNSSNPTDSTSANNADSSPSSSSGSSGRTAGIAVGVTVGVLAVLGAAAFFLWRRRRQRKQESGREATAAIAQHEAKELYSPEQVVEIGYGKDPAKAVELPS